MNSNDIWNDLETILYTNQTSNSPVFSWTEYVNSGVNNVRTNYINYYGMRWKHIPMPDFDYIEKKQFKLLKIL